MLILRKKEVRSFKNVCKHILLTHNQMVSVLFLCSRWGRKIGLIGLVEKEWLDTLATINPEEVTYTDYVTAGTMLAKELKEQKGCEVVIALTHMRTHNDIR